MLHHTGLQATALIAPSSLWSRTDGLILLNHPLLIQISTGKLPMGSFHRLLQDRRLLVSALRDGATAACADLMEDPSGLESSMKSNSATT